VCQQLAVHRNVIALLSGAAAEAAKSQQHMLGCRSRSAVKSLDGLRLSGVLRVFDAKVLLLAQLVAHLHEHHLRAASSLHSITSQHDFSVHGLRTMMLRSFTSASGTSASYQFERSGRRASHDTGSAAGYDIPSFWCPSDSQSPTKHAPLVLQESMPFATIGLQDKAHRLGMADVGHLLAALEHGAVHRHGLPDEAPAAAEVEAALLLAVVDLRRLLRVRVLQLVDLLAALACRPHAYLKQIMRSLLDRYPKF